MKKSLLSIAFVLCSCLNTFSQATSLTIDCQNPGWLASYISPTTIQNIRSLKVTGTINSTDLATIGNLVKNYQLRERLDLENVDVEGNILSGDMFGVTGCQLQYFSLPLSVTKLENCVNWVKLDTLVCGSIILPNFDLGGYLPIIDAKCLILREGVTYISYGPEESPTEEIIFPNSMKYINGLSGRNLTKINIPPAVEHLGPIIGTKLNLNEETLYIPKSVKYFDDRWGTGGYINGYISYGKRDENGKIKCIYLPEGLDTLYVQELHGYSGNQYTDPGAKVDIHIKAKTPPRVQNGTLGYNTIVYVPVGYKEVYKGTGGSNGTMQWGGATILEEIYAERIDISAPEILYVGDSHELKVEFTPYNTSFTDVTWGVSDGEILSIEKDGTCTALRYGEVQVIATNADRSCTDTKTIKVYDHTTGVNISESSLKLKIREKAILAANTLPLETSDGMITWSTDDELVATVDYNGGVRGVGTGTCTIKATTVDGGYTATCEVTVTQPVEALTLEKHELNLSAGETGKLYAQIVPVNADDKAVVWSSSDDEVAMVDANGVVTAVKGGEAWIKVVSEDNMEAKDSCKVTITQPVTGIQLSETSATLNDIGQTIILKAAVTPENASNSEVKWTSSNESVCVVSNGTVVAVGEGTCVIIVTTQDGGYIATCTVTVAIPNSISTQRSLETAPFKIFDVNGVERRTLQRGINIIRFDDGTMKKVFVKRN
ncbi:MAG: Ig-like domain-containing protein [Prevotella sp.]|nr:Ig-like domain-containing protein [Prevotella sp.]